MPFTCSICEEESRRICVRLQPRTIAITTSARSALDAATAVAAKWNAECVEGDAKEPCRVHRTETEKEEEFLQHPLGFSAGLTSGER